MSEYQRPSWDEYFLEVMHALAKRGTCNRGRNACVIVKDHQILVTGYVGAPSGLPHCDEVGHLMRATIHEDGSRTNHCVRTLHAEQNAVCQAARRGVSIEGATAYIRFESCWTCAMLFISCGIKRVVCEYKYHAGAEATKLMQSVGIQVDFVHNELVEYDTMRPGEED